MEVNELINNLKSNKYKYIKITFGTDITIRQLSKIANGKIYSYVPNSGIMIERPLPRRYKMIENGYIETIYLGKYGGRKVRIEFLSHYNKFK